MITSTRRLVITPSTEMIFIGLYNVAIVSVVLLNVALFLVTYLTSPYNDLLFIANQFMYASNQLFAFGVRNYIDAIHNTYTNGSIDSVI